MTSTDGVVIDERLVIRSDASGPEERPHGAAEPAGRLRGARGGPRRHPARGPRLRPQRRGRGAQRGLRPPRPARHQHPRRPRRRQERGGRGGPPRRVRGAQRRRPARRGDGADAATARSSGSRWPSRASPTRAMVDRHCRDGGLALVLERGELGESIVLRQGKRAMQVAFTHLLPATFGGKARFNVANAMAAAGACFAAGAHLHDIRAGLRTFSTSYHLAPGRLNHIDVNGVNVFVDYAHNPAGPGGARRASSSPTPTASTRPGAELHKRRRIGVIGTAGDRRDEDIIELGRTGGPALRPVRGQGGRQAPRPPAGRGGRAGRAGGARGDGEGARCQGGARGRRRRSRRCGGRSSRRRPATSSPSAPTGPTPVSPRSRPWATQAMHE